MKNISELTQCRIAASGEGPAEINIGADGSDFLRIAVSVPVSKLLPVLDEHMSAVQMLYPKEYAAVLRKLQES